ncbi:unnamed protein product [Orchesella dallaii]|uniref:Uncharacterized protein n=1 Tax=Orchesella dallaii TaxID=48710 RepID=A0ABP1PVU2_9HEXA
MTEDKLMAKTKKQLKEWIKINEKIAHFNLTWVDEVTKLCIVYNRLRQEIDEAAISTKERVVNRLHCVITNPAMFKWIKYSLKIVESSLNIMGKQLDFTEEITRFFKLMRRENKTWNQMVPSFHDSETYENMSIEDLKVVLGRWTERNE